ncbi:AzlD domain-containing protein [Mariniluteicoccus flavus]
MWTWILLACLIAFVTKGVGYLVPAERLQHPRILRVAGTMTIGLLAALVMMNTFAAEGPTLAVDARLAALVAGAIALMLRAPYLVVVLVGALAAALVRLAGWG